jgi:hypothetical protein
MRPSSSNRSRAGGPICRARLSKRGGTARHPGLHQDNIPVLVARDRKRATFDAVLPQDDSASIARALAGVVTASNQLSGDGGKAIAASARKAKIPFHAVPAPASRRPRRRTCTSTTSTPTTAASNNGWRASTASSPRTCRTTSAGDARSKPGIVKSPRKTGSRAPSEPAHTNN